MTDVSNAEFERILQRRELKGNFRILYLEVSNTKTLKFNAHYVPSSYEVRLLDTKPHARSEHMRRRTLPTQSFLVRFPDPLRRSALAVRSFGKQLRRIVCQG